MGLNERRFNNFPLRPQTDRDTSPSRDYDEGLYWYNYNNGELAKRLIRNAKNKDINFKEIGIETVKSVANYDMIGDSYHLVRQTDLSVCGVGNCFIGIVGVVSGTVDAAVNFVTLGGKTALQKTATFGLKKLFVKEVEEVVAKEVLKTGGDLAVLQIGKDQTVNKSVDCLLKVRPDEKVIDITKDLKLVSSNDGLVTIVAHGPNVPFDKILNYSSEELANYIKLNFKNVKIVELLVCKSGKSIDGSISFAENLSSSLKGVAIKAPIENVNLIKGPFKGVPFVRDPNNLDDFLDLGEGWKWFYQK